MPTRRPSPHSDPTFSKRYAKGKLKLAERREWRRVAAIMEGAFQNALRRGDTDEKADRKAVEAGRWAIEAPRQPSPTRKQREAELAAMPPAVREFSRALDAGVKKRTTLRRRTKT